jgi:hypothetical protein
MNEVRLTFLPSVPSAPHASHFSGAGASTFCKTSWVAPHFEQLYS